MLQGLDVIRCKRYHGVYGYQDEETNRLRLYSKASDIFSFACILFEMWTGSCLLRYVHDFGNSSLEREEYLRVYKEGRISGINKWTPPYVGAPRKMLTDRVKQSGIKISPLINLMIEPRETRITAPEILDGDVIKFERAYLTKNQWKLDEG